MKYRNIARSRTNSWLMKVVGAIAIVFLVQIAFPAVSQFPPIPAVPRPSPQASPSPTPSPQILNLDLPSFGNRTPSEAEDINKSYVWLDGQRLFAIAALAGSSADEVNTLELRTQIIENRLWQVVDSSINPETIDVVSRVNPSSNLPVLFVLFDSETGRRELELMTVTALDAQIHGSEPVEWADELSQIVKTALIRAERDRTSEVIQQQAVWATGIFFGMIAASLLVTQFQKRLQRERHTLAAAERADLLQYPTPGPVDPGATEEAPPIPSQIAHQRLDRRQQRGINDILRRLLQLTQGIIWIGGIYLLFGQFATTRWLQPFLLHWLQIPFRILLVIFVTYLLLRLADVLIDRFFMLLRDEATFAPEQTQRSALRFSTFARVTKGISGLIIIAVAVITALSFIGVQIGPLLAGAGILGFAISLASQNMIKDMINGFLILLEDQYGVGDIIVVDKVSGLVENMNLRITQLRNEEGRLITIPNGAISIVQNLSKEWSRVDLQVSVAYSADLDKALAVIDEVAQEMSRDRHWGNLILEKPQMLGVDKLDYTGATIRLWIKTQPLKQWDVAREYRRRLKRAFDQTDIPIGIPQQSLWIGNPQELDQAIEDKPGQSNPVQN